MNYEYDVIVVGAGNAALCAAMSAQENGAKVLVLERAPREQRGGNSAFTSGNFRMVHNGLDDIKKFVPDLSDDEIANTDFGQYTRDQFFEDLGRVTEYRSDPDLAEVLIDKSTETVQWIREKGLRFLPLYGVQAHKVDGKYKFWGGLVVTPVGGGRGLVDHEFNAAERQGVEIRYHTRAVSLLNDEHGVYGVEVISGRKRQNIHAKAVVLACGGFEANREWRIRYLGQGWDLAKVRGTRYNTGDGIRMALDIGAQPHGHWGGAHAVGWDLSAPDFGDQTGDGPLNHGKHSYPLGIMINANGERFVDEGADIRNFTYAKYGQLILRQPGQFCWQIFDAKAIPMLRDQYRIKKLVKVTAQSIEELVTKLDGVNAAGALKTIREFNAAVKTDAPFDPNVLDGRSTTGLPIPKSNWARPFDTPPYEAYAATCGITFTFGGLKITTKAEVVDVEDAPIPGLFAAGELVGGIFYFNYPGGAGLMNGAVFGRVAGASAAVHASAGSSRE